MENFWRNLWFFKYSLGLTVLAVGVAYYYGGLSAALIVLLLGFLEVSLSFDNAVINAGVLQRMSPFWQKLFLTVGIIIAVFGMRVILPLVVVAVTAGIDIPTVWNLAINDPARYGEYLHDAHPAIAAFGGIFLLMIFLDFLLNQGKQIHWIEWIERPLAKAGRVEAISVILALSALLGATSAWAGEHAETVLFSGLMGLLTYLFVGSLAKLFEQIGNIKDDEAEVVKQIESGRKPKLATGKAAAFLFLYLEVLDASFSFDGVIGAFAITNNVLAIALGLGIGAIFVRSLTVFLVRERTLQNYVYLEHGAHYAIGALALLLGASLAYDVPEVVTGLVGVGFIILSVASSVMERRRAQAAKAA